MNDFDGNFKLIFWTIYDGGGFKYKLLLLKFSASSFMHVRVDERTHLFSWRNENWKKEKKYFAIVEIRSAVLSDSGGKLRIFDALDHSTTLMNSVFTATQTCTIHQWIWHLPHIFHLYLIEIILSVQVQ